MGAGGRGLALKRGQPGKKEGSGRRTCKSNNMFTTGTQSRRLRHGSVREGERDKPMRSEIKLLSTLNGKSYFTARY
jgi:hypothetical protein